MNVRNSNGVGRMKGETSHMKVKGLIIFMLIRFSSNLYLYTLHIMYTIYATSYLNVLFSIIKFMWHFIECACFIEFSLIISTIEFHFVSHLVSITCTFDDGAVVVVLFDGGIGGYVASIVCYNIQNECYIIMLIG